MTKPVLAVTMGDPAGVGPEICLRLLNHQELLTECLPVVFGDADVMRRVAGRTGLTLNAPVLKQENWPDRRDASPSILDLGAIDAQSIQPGLCDAATGRASYCYIERAIHAALAGDVSAVCTAPINKEALRGAGFDFPGHTEIFAHLTGAQRWCMMQYSEEITCTFVTVHVGYAEVPRLLTIERILEVIELTDQQMRTLRNHAPTIVVCGLNPHAGEHGLFGNSEEQHVISPAIELAQAKGIRVSGPLPPDTAFLPQKRRETDAFVCMYHDQGHIPVKALAFDSAVNTTIGLPIVRTSVDHGTAQDIAWQGKAKPDSLLSAVRLALRIVGDAAPHPRADDRS